MTDALVNLHTFDNRQEADLAKGALEANGIHAIVSSDDAGSQEVSLQFVRGAKLLVNREDYLRAKSVLKLG